MQDCLPCLILLLRMTCLLGSGFGCVTAMGAVFVMVVIVAAGSIRVDMSTLRMNLDRRGISCGHKNHGFILAVPWVRFGWGSDELPTKKRMPLC